MGLSLCYENLDYKVLIATRAQVNVRIGYISMKLNECLSDSTALHYRDEIAVCEDKLIQAHEILEE